MPRCEHGRLKWCRACHWHAFCPHGRQPARCKECAGASFCVHGRQTSQCRDCSGSSFCSHMRRRGTCKHCGGSQICTHGRIRRSCSVCDPFGNLLRRVRGATRNCFAQVGRRKDTRTIQLLGCSQACFKAFIARKMTEYNLAAPAKPMTWTNIHLDHIKPISSMKDGIDPAVLHFTNYQPLLAEHNLSKGARWSAEDEAFWRENIRGNPHAGIYMPRMCGDVAAPLVRRRRKKYILAEANSHTVGTGMRNKVTPAASDEATTEAPHVVASRTRKAKGLLAPETAPPAKLGKNIVANQPDVEVLALVLKKTPCTRESFEASKPADKDWVFLQFCVLGAGPPGFSSVPYTSTKKKGEKDADTEPLFAATSNGTMFYSFAKGRTNKDRGRRVEEVDGVPVTAVLQPGVCLTMFLREDNDAFEPGKVFVKAPDVIPENSFVFLQVGVANAEQAAAGRLLKIKRVMPVTDLGVVSAFLGGMPASADDHETVMIESKDSFPALGKCTTMPASRVHTVALDATAYASEEGDGAALVSADQSFYISPRVLAECLPACNVARARKLLSIALAMQAVTVLVRSSSREDVLMERPPNEVVHLDLNVSRMLSLHSLAESAATVQTEFRGDEVWWVDMSKSILLPPDEEFQVAWALQLEPRTQEEARSTQAPGFLSDGCAGDFHRLRAFMYAKQSLHEFVHGSQHDRLAMSLQLRPGLRSQASAGGKRRREMLEADPLDESDME